LSAARGIRMHVLTSGMIFDLRDFH
jgi:hypothetical protein